MDKNLFLKNGWVHFPSDPVLAEWVDYTLPHAQRLVASPENRQWLRCGGTWFAGVNLLNNDADGKVDHGPPLAGEIIEFIRKDLGFAQISWDCGQISVCYPGYPKPMESESEAAFNYRLKRDAAHVDGLLPEGPDRRRHLREHHAFILGIPLTDASYDASPLVVWEGSHEIIRSAFKTAFTNLPAQSWEDIDVTDLYQKARRQIFDTYKRVKVFAKPGECYLIHRLALHGISPWAENATAGINGRMICYFRPDVSGPAGWLNNP